MLFGDICWCVVALLTVLAISRRCVIRGFLSFGRFFLLFGQPYTEFYWLRITPTNLGCLWTNTCISESRNGD